MNAVLNLLEVGTFWKVLIYCAIGGAVCLFVLAVLPDEKRIAARKRLGMVADGAQGNRILLLRILRPLFSLLLLYFSGRVSESQRTLLHRKLLSANVRDELTPEEFLAFKAVMTLVIPALTAFLTGLLGVSIPIALWPVVFLAGYFSPNLWLAERIGKRRREIIRALPYTLDLLTLSVEAGLDFIAAIRRLVQRSKPNALLTELSHMLREIRLGTSRSDALRSLSERLQIEEISSFTTLLVQADQLGASVGAVLRAQSDQLRSKRFQGAEAAGAKASNLILFPLALCILPAIVIIMVGPAILGILQQGLF